VIAANSQKSNDQSDDVEFYLRPERHLAVYRVLRNGAWTLLKNGAPVKLKQIHRRINPSFALQLLSRLLEAKKPLTCHELKGGTKCSDDWLRKQMSLLKRAVPSVYILERKSLASDSTRFRASDELIVSHLPASQRPGLHLAVAPHENVARSLRDRILRSLEEATGSVTPVLHTLSLVLRPGGFLREVWGKKEIGKGEAAFPSLTGRGDAEALRNYQRHCDRLGISVAESVGADDFKPADMREKSVFWIGSCFNELHKLESTLRDQKLWKRMPKCWLRGLRKKGTLVTYPDAPKIITNTPHNDDAFALIRSVLYKGSNANNTRLVVAAGTNTDATLWAATLLLHDDHDTESAAWLAKALGEPPIGADLQFEAIFQMYPCVKLLWSSGTSDRDVYSERKHGGSARQDMQETENET
jgi:hypothetical protein